MGRPAAYERGGVISYRPHVRVYDVMNARAAKAGLSRAEYTEYLIAKALGMSDCAPKPERTDDPNQEALLPDPHS